MTPGARVAVVVLGVLALVGAGVLVHRLGDQDGTASVPRVAASSSAQSGSSAPSVGASTGSPGPSGLSGSSGSSGSSATSAVPSSAADSVLRLAFAGDTHFQDDQAGVPSRADSTLGPLSAVLRSADLAMLNLETVVTDSDQKAPKELEVASNRFWFKDRPGVFGVLARSGVDVVTGANNHAGDYGVTGLRDTLTAAAKSPVALVGAGLDAAQAFAPYRVRMKGVDIAVFGADASFRESAGAVWAAAPGTGPGLASARGADTGRLLSAVRASAAVDDLVVVDLHWGAEFDSCPTGGQQSLAQQLVAAGADIVVGSHSHVLQGAGRPAGNPAAYVAYGLGNFYWNHGRQPSTGVLTLTVQGGRVTGDQFAPATIPASGGAPQPLAGTAASAAVDAWRALRGCTDLAAGPDSSAPVDTTSEAAAPGLPSFASSVAPIDATLRASMRSHVEGTCPVPLADLRHVTLTYLGFDGRAHRGDLVVNADVTDDVEQVFASLYAARFPIASMRLIDDFGGDDDASMAADNSSAYNCRRVAGTTTWSNHAYGRAVDINPVENPYLVGTDVRPPAAALYAAVDRSSSAPASSSAAGVIVDGGPVRTAFAAVGWDWGGNFDDPDFQHFDLESR